MHLLTNRLEIVKKNHKQTKDNGMSGCKISDAIKSRVLPIFCGTAIDKIFW